jgi:hypothetical protein
MRQKQNAKYQNMILLAQLFDRCSVQVRSQNAARPGSAALYQSHGRVLGPDCASVVTIQLAVRATNWRLAAAWE